MIREKDVLIVRIVQKYILWERWRIVKRVRKYYLQLLLCFIRPRIMCVAYLRTIANIKLAFRIFTDTTYVK